ncbi:MAG: hypothetical protein HFF44_04780 [Lawsonibacter sp.]|nr:hypothetical protein [Lawsonibacter sp.]
MPTNQTPNYQLSQWEKSDKVLMDDFNADNAKIDAALKAETDARAALAARSGNCQIWTTSYVGTGDYGYENRNSVTFPKKPLLAAVLGESQSAMLSPLDGIFLLNGGTSYDCLEWSGTTALWYNGFDRADYQLNTFGKTYHVVALFAKDS